MFSPAPASEAIPTLYPARTREVAANLSGIPTTVTSVSFADKILITVSQNGNLAQWFHVPLNATSTRSSNPSYSVVGLDPHEDDPEQSMLPVSHLTPTTLFGGGGPEREAVGQLYAVQIASAIRMRNADESRTVLVGLGLEEAARPCEARVERGMFFDILGLVGQVL